MEQDEGNTSEGSRVEESFSLDEPDAKHDAPVVVRETSACEAVISDDPNNNNGSKQSLSAQAKLAIVRILARECGATSEDEIMGMLNGINLVEMSDGDGEILVAGDDQWQDVEFEVALDSGSVVHVCSSEDAPGYQLDESLGSKRGQNFLMGDGGKVPNQGQKALNLSGSTADLKSVFQIAQVTRPLMSVGKICDEGFTVTFYKTHASILDKNGKDICRFERQPGGLYVAKLKLKSPSFARQ